MGLIHLSALFMCVMLLAVTDPASSFRELEATTRDTVHVPEHERAKVLSMKANVPVGAEEEDRGWQSSLTDIARDLDFFRLPTDTGDANARFRRFMHMFARFGRKEGDLVDGIASELKQEAIPKTDEQLVKGLKKILPSGRASKLDVDFKETLRTVFSEAFCNHALLSLEEDIPTLFKQDDELGHLKHNDLYKGFAMFHLLRSGLTEREVVALIRRAEKELQGELESLKFSRMVEGMMFDYYQAAKLNREAILQSLRDGKPLLPIRPRYV